MVFPHKSLVSRVVHSFMQNAILLHAAYITLCTLVCTTTLCFTAALLSSDLAAFTDTHSQILKHEVAKISPVITCLPILRRCGTHNSPDQPAPSRASMHDLPHCCRQADRMVSRRLLYASPACTNIPRQSMSGLERDRLRRYFAMDEDRDEYARCRHTGMSGEKRT